MRIRPLAALSATALSVLLLAGCSSAEPGADGDATPTTAPVVDLCDAQVASGSAVESVTVEGEVGEKSTATFTTPIEIDELQSTVIAEGTGEAAAAGDLVTYALSAFDAETGEEKGSVGYADSPTLPQQISPDNPLGQLLGCASPGTRVVAAFPATDQAAGEVYIIDLLDVVPSAAWGEPQEPVDGMPVVELADNGEPTITVGDVATPDETELAVLKKGDGPVVASGDTVLVQYTGVLTDGTVFDSSWTKGAPVQFQTTGVVPGFQKALEGQTVGSQVLAVIPPAEGYGDAEQGTIPANSTLIFVVDILGAQSAQ